MRKLLGFFSDWSTPFQHNDPKNFVWSQDDMSLTDVVFYTDKKMMMPNKIGRVKVGMVYEPREINQEVHNWVKRHHHEMDYIFTWDKELAAQIPNAIYMVYGVSWLNEKFYSMYPKTKACSIVVSEKRVLAGHILRHDVVSRYRSKFDLYGRGYNKIESLLQAYADYRFTIVIENTNQDCNLSEKIVTPILCGTIPIYWGCPSVGDTFNEKGLIRFYHIDELKDILDSLTEEKYQEMLPYAQANFEKAKTLQSADDNFYLKLKELGVIKEEA